jgi:hypothetical protein
VEAQKPRLTGGMESSLYMLPVEHYQLLFTVDEDPVFEQLTVTLLHAVERGLYEETLDSTIHALYDDFTQGGSHG